MTSAEREQRKFQTKAHRFNINPSDNRDEKFFLQLNKSSKGLGGIFFGHQFPGKGTVLKSAQQEYMVRWVKPRFGFIYQFGLEAIAKVSA